MSEPAIAAHGLVKSYGDVRALDGIDLEPRGERLEVALLEPACASRSRAVRA